MLALRTTNRKKSLSSNLKGSKDTTKEKPPKKPLPLSRKRTAVRQRRWAEKNPKRAWATYTVTRCKARAAKKGLPFDLTIDYLEEILPDTCPVFGTKFYFKGNRVQGPTSPSIDRLVPQKGYVKGNVAIISLKANMIKGANRAEAVYRVYKWMRKLGLK